MDGHFENKMKIYLSLSTVLPCADRSDFGIDENALEERKQIVEAAWCPREGAASELGS